MTSIDELAHDYWQARLDAAPTERHLLGDYSEVGRFEDPSLAAEDRQIAGLRDFAARAAALSEDGLDTQARLTRALIVDAAAVLADLLETRLSELSADPVHGPQVSLRLVLPMLTIPDAAAAASMPAKLTALGDYLRGLGERAREGVARGWAPARFAVEGTIAQVDELLALPLDQDPHLQLAPLPEGVDEAAFAAAVREAVARSVRPGFAVFGSVLRDEVLPIARPDDQVGLCHLPGGDAAYAQCLRFYTTTGLTAQQIHELGLAQVAALAAEYRELGPQVVGSDDLEQIFTAMRADPELHFRDGEELVERSRVALARAEAVAPGWFHRVNEAPCVVSGTPVGPKAFYYPPASDGSRGGTFFVNTADPSSWGRFELEAMAYHEGVPGHHLQLALAAELPDSFPDFRKHDHHTAYAEGWGLYSERLSDEMGLYSEPIDRLGMLSADSMRACRLVVDTGLHALGWSRQQAVDYMLANSPLTEGVVRPEIDRYICTPGQATSYMVGRLEIERIRREAQQRLGERFDIRDFHSAVLESGSLPLGVLDAHVRATLP